MNREKKEEDRASGTVNVSEAAPNVERAKGMLQCWQAQEQLSNQIMIEGECISASEKTDDQRPSQA